MFDRKGMKLATDRNRWEAGSSGEGNVEGIVIEGHISRLAEQGEEGEG